MALLPIFMSAVNYCRLMQIRNNKIEGNNSEDTKIYGSFFLTVPCQESYIYIYTRTSLATLQTKKGKQRKPNPNTIQIALKCADVIMITLR